MNIVGGPGVTLNEVTQAAEIIHSVAHPDANIIFGSVIDDSIGEAVRVTVIAAGFDATCPEGNRRRVEPSMTEGPRSDIFTSHERRLLRRRWR